MRKEIRKAIRKEVDIFFNALMFYSRIPCPSWVKYDEEMLNLATRYFPLIGWIVGGICAGTYVIALQFFSSITALILSLIVLILTTGAFHEDGFADSCDAFGGGWTKDKILQIMKDSRIGTYGTVGLILIFLLKISILYDILAQMTSLVDVMLLFISAHALSRFTTATFVATHDYARETDDSKTKPLAKKMTSKTFWIACFFGVLPLLIWCFWSGHFWMLSVMIPLYFIKYRLGLFFEKWIAGYTGDCLGATQQMTEVAFYLVIMMITSIQIIH